MITIPFSVHMNRAGDFMLRQGNIELFSDFKAAKSVLLDRDYYIIYAEVKSVWLILWLGFSQNTALH